MRNLGQIQGIIFDLGKTLMFIPNEYDLESGIAKLVGQTRENVAMIIYDLCHKYLKISAEDFTNKLCQKLNKNNKPDLGNNLRTICQNSVQESRLQSDALYALSTLKKRGYKLSLVSNTSPLSKSRIQKLNIVDYFDYIVFSCDVGYSKPDPRIFLHAIHLMGIVPQQTCIIGDRIRTIALGADILGARLILVERRMQDVVVSEQVPVDAIVPNLVKLVELPMLKGIENG